MATQTTNYHLVKPAYGESADVAVINSNMDTIDSTMKTNADDISTVSGQLSYKTIGTFTTESGLGAALDSEFSSMGTYSQRAIRFNFSSASGAFTARYYYGTLTKAGSNSYGSMIVVTTSSDVADVVSGSKNNSSWVFGSENDKIDKKAEGRLFTITSSAPATFTMTSNARITLLCGSAYTSHAGVINLSCTSGGTADYYVIAGASALTLSKSGANVTISSTYGVNGTAIIHAGSVTIS